MKGRARTCLAAAQATLASLVLQVAGAETTAEQDRIEQSPVVLEERLETLGKELEQTREALAEARAAGQAANERAKKAAQRLESVKLEPARIRFGRFTIGGAIRANYTVGDYPSGQGATRSSDDGGNFNLDIFRVNVDYLNGSWLGKFEYRFYNGYHFPHTAWIGYQFNEKSTLKLGLNRVPFGPGPYGVSQSWLFDQHYYLGLSDDMDLGVKYTRRWGRWLVDAAWYLRDEGDYRGSSNDSARYSYDVVNESGNGYDERNQVNARARYSFDSGNFTHTAGLSIQHGQLDSAGPQDNGTHSAGSLHWVSKWQHFTFAGQLSYYEFNVDTDQPLNTDQLVQFGAYDFPNTVASRAWVPAVSLSFYQATPNSDWLDYFIPYIEYSAVRKAQDGFNDSAMFVLGTAWAWDGWYIYIDLARSNGNEFVGGETSSGDRLGANPDNRWQTRFNINFGYYF